MSDIKRDIEKLERLTAVANASLATSSVILTAHSNAANVVGSSLGGAFVSALPSGGISAFAGHSIGGATLLSATGGIGASGALTSALDEGQLRILFEFIKWLWDVIFGSSDEEKKAKENLKRKLEEALETQNRIARKIEDFCEQLKQDYAKSKRVDPDKMNELLTLNYALKNSLKSIKASCGF